MQTEITAEIEDTTVLYQAIADIIMTQFSIGDVVPYEWFSSAYDLIDVKSTSHFSDQASGNVWGFITMMDEVKGLLEGHDLRLSDTGEGSFLIEREANAALNTAKHVILNINVALLSDAEIHARHRALFRLSNL